MSSFRSPSARHTLHAVLIGTFLLLGGVFLAVNRADTPSLLGQLRSCGEDGKACNSGSRCAVSCSDTDDYNPRLGGGVELIDQACNRQAFMDACASDTVVVEHYCRGNNHYADNIPCPGGCYGGACLSRASACSQPSDCNDDDRCTKDTCSGGVCYHFALPSCGAISSLASCTDSDGGSKPGVRGFAVAADGERLNDVCKDRSVLSEAYCVGPRAQAISMTCVGGCQNGHCSMPLSPAFGASSSVMTCADSDGGMNYGTWGAVRGERGDTVTVVYDRCGTQYQAGADRKILVEAYCAEWGPATQEYYCPGFCAGEGLCIAEIPSSSLGSSSSSAFSSSFVSSVSSSAVSSSSSSSSSSCTDTDGGQKPDVWGYVSGAGVTTLDQCAGENTLLEAYCSASGPAMITLSCPGICRGGMCIPVSSSSSSAALSSQVSCRDTDGGRNFELWGYVTSADVSIADQCVDWQTLVEAYCTSSGPALFSVTCTGFCQSGMCVQAAASSAAICGDGHLGGAEQCDDANLSNGDGCSMFCQWEAWSSSSAYWEQAYCGDGYLDEGEECEVGDAHCPSGTSCHWETCRCVDLPPSSSSAQASSLAVAVVARCGDGLLDDEEECEVGVPCAEGSFCGVGCVCFDLSPASSDSSVDAIVTESSSSEASSARSVASCANGVLEGEETCEVGLPCRTGFCVMCKCVVLSSSAASSLRSSASSRSSSAFVCGDGRVEGGEECDDDNTAPGDGCSFRCVVENGYACTGQPSDCQPVCGDAIRTAYEECDDGDRMNGDGCSSFCEVEYSAAPVSSSDFAERSSVPSVICGNGSIEWPEQCDDGNYLDGDGCSHSCFIEAASSSSEESSLFSSSSSEKSISSTSLVLSSSSAPVLMPASASGETGTVLWIWVFIGLLSFALVIVFFLILRTWQGRHA